MKDITSTSFGILIAFVLPGMVGLLALALVSPAVAAIAQRVIDPLPSWDLLVVALLAAVTLSLWAHVIRSLVFEKWLCKNRCPKPSHFADVARDAALVRVMADEEYRYHQFWGAMSIFLVSLYIALVYRFWGRCTRAELALWAAVAAALLALNVWGAYESLCRYYDRISAPFGEDSNAKRISQKGGKLEPEDSIAPVAEKPSPSTTSPSATTSPSTASATPGSIRGS